jgi:threonine aldolase
MDTIDLRSDTVSWPTQAMRDAMANAQVGDDVWGDDPTVHHLQAMAAQRMGKEAALFVPSGTMANLVSALVHCGRGDELILGDQSHTFRYEAGGVSAIGSIHPHTLHNRTDGTIALEDVAGAIRPRDNPHFPRTAAIFVENTHNICGGVAIPPPYFQALRQIADHHGVSIHLDGARIFNAAIALGCAVEDITQHVDTVSFCLSKGLCAPVGSVICGPAGFVEQANRMRKVLGGGMRQAGIIAAAGIVALEQMVDRLADDHRNARRLAEGLAQIEGIEIDPVAVQTNLVFFGLNDKVPIDPGTLIRRLDQEHNVKIGSRGGRRFRAVTHFWITPERIEIAVEGFRAVLTTTH